MIRSASGRDTLTCNVCEKDFSRLWTLQRHLTSKIHLERARIRSEFGNPHDVLMRPLAAEGNALRSESDEVVTTEMPPFDEEDMSVGDRLFLNNRLRSEFLDINHERSTSSAAADEDHKSHLNYESEWFPFKNKTEMFLAALVAYPCRPSKSFLQYLWFILRCLGIEDLTPLEKVEELLSTLPNLLKPMKAVTASTNSVFYYIPPSLLLSQLFSTPRLRELMQLYPNDDLEVYASLNQSGKVNGSVHLQTPMLNLMGTRIFHHDLVKIVHDSAGNFSFVLVRGFLLKNNVYHVKGYEYNWRTKCLDIRKMITLPAVSGRIKVHELKFQIEQLLVSPDQNIEDNQVDDICKSFETPHYLKERSQNEDLDVFTIPFTLFSDDTSANASKKWNKVDVIYLKLASKS
jgi:hypothetical protein